MLDRDGVLNEVREGSYVTRPEEFHWIPGAREALRDLAQAGMRAALVTNQAAIGKSLATRAQIDALHAWMLAGIPEADLKLESIYICPHVEGDRCTCRKPQPGLLFSALRDHAVAASDSTLIGDTWRDAQAAAAAKVPFLLVRTGRGHSQESKIRAMGVACAGVFDDLYGAVQALVTRGGEL